MCFDLRTLLCSPPLLFLFIYFFLISSHIHHIISYSSQITRITTSNLHHITPHLNTIFSSHHTNQFLHKYTSKIFTEHRTNNKRRTKVGGRLTLGSAGHPASVCAGALRLSPFVVCFTGRSTPAEAAATSPALGGRKPYAGRRRPPRADGRLPRALRQPAKAPLAPV
jgi:hypothetical protein